MSFLTTDLREDQQNAILTAVSHRVTLVVADRAWGKTTIGLNACRQVAESGMVAIFHAPDTGELDWILNHLSDTVTQRRGYVVRLGIGRIHFIPEYLADSSRGVNPTLTVIDNVNYFSPPVLIRIVDRTRGPIMLLGAPPSLSVHSSYGDFWLNQAIKDAPELGWEVVTIKSENKHLA